MSPVPSGPETPGGLPLIVDRRDRVGRLLAELSDGDLEAVIPRLENELQALLGVAHFALAASGLSALQAALSAVGVRPGDEVVCDVLVPYATLSILNMGAVPVPADINERTLTLCPLSLGNVLSARTRAVLATASFGVPPDSSAFLGVLAGATEISIIIDACQAVAASSPGAALGPGVDVACFSFQAGKPLSCGYGGGIATLSEKHDVRARRYLSLGWYPRSSAFGDTTWDPSWQTRTRGESARLPPIAAALLLARLPEFRAAAASRLEAIREAESAIGRIPDVRLQCAGPGFNGQRWRIAALARDGEHARQLAHSLRAQGSLVYRPCHPPASEWPALRLAERAPLRRTRAALETLLLFPVETPADAERESRAVLRVL